MAAVPEDEPLVFRVARETGVMERHEAAIVDLCQTPGASDKQVEDCVVTFLSSGYDDSSTTIKVATETEEDTEKESDGDRDDEDESDDMLDTMLNMWADDLPMPPTTSGITDMNGEDSRPGKAKPWSSRSSPSGTFVRDPVTGEMRNIDA